MAHAAPSIDFRGTHEVLQQSKIMSAIAKGVAGAMPKHVRPNIAEPGATPRLSDEVVYCLAGEGLAAFGD